jgi:hypothetical protein
VTLTSGRDSLVPEVLLGRVFGASGLGVVREELALDPAASRAELARRVCQRLDWRTPGGTWALLSARVALLRLHRCGLVGLPPARNGNGNGRAPVHSAVHWPAEQPLTQPVDQLADLALHPVVEPSQSALYNALVDRYHYLGLAAMAGAQMRYLIGWEGGFLGVLGFGAAAWRVRDRDRFIGWDEASRRAHLHLVIGNARFLILPWVHCPHLASKVLALGLGRLPTDFRQRYGYSPVLVESFVQEDRVPGICYRAANWQYVGRTQGRGKLGQWQDRRVPRKAIWVYPLHSRFRQILTAPPPPL